MSYPINEKPLQRPKAAHLPWVQHFGGTKFNCTAVSCAVLIYIYPRWIYTLLCRCDEDQHLQAIIFTNLDKSSSLLRNIYSQSVCPTMKPSIYEYIYCSRPTAPIYNHPIDVLITNVSLYLYLSLSISISESIWEQQEEKVRHKHVSKPKSATQFRNPAIETASPSLNHTRFLHTYHTFQSQQQKHLSH